MKGFPVVVVAGGEIEAVFGAGDGRGAVEAVFGFASGVWFGIVR